MTLKITTVIVIIGALFAAWFHIDRTKADAADFQAFKHRAECRWNYEAAEFTQKAMWRLEDRYGEEEAEKTLLYQEAVRKLKRINKALKQCDTIMGDK